MLLFGLTAAFLFAMIQKVWPLEDSSARESKCSSISAQPTKAWIPTEEIDRVFERPNLLRLI